MCVLCAPYTDRESLEQQRGRLSSQDNFLHTFFLSVSIVFLRYPARYDCSLYYKLTNEPKCSGELKLQIQYGALFLQFSIYWSTFVTSLYLSQLVRLWYLSHRRPTKAQASPRIRAVSPEPSLFAHMKQGSRRKVRPKIRHLAPLDGCACVFEECVYGGRKVP